MSTAGFRLSTTGCKSAMALALHHGSRMSSNTTESLPSLSTDDLLRVAGGGRLSQAIDRAEDLGLTVTSTTGGRHTPGSYHYKGRAADVSGSAKAMRQFYREMSKTNPTELFYDPMGGMKHGRNIGAIGGHGRHVHIAY